MVRFFTKPVVAGVLFNATVMILHVPLLVNASLDNGALHYALHVLVVGVVAADVDAGVRTGAGVPDGRRRAR